MPEQLPLAAANLAADEVARELHDVVAHQLTAVLMELELLKTEVGGDHAVKRIASLQARLRAVLAEVRRILYEMRGEAPLERLTDSIRDQLLVPFRERTKIRTALSVGASWPDTLPAAAAYNIYRIVEEAINNAHLHSGAQVVEVSLRAVEDSLQISIHDDGLGGSWLESERRLGMGVLGMRERAMLLAGELEIMSSRGRGTTVTVVFPRLLVR